MQFYHKFSLEFGITNNLVIVAPILALFGSAIVLLAVIWDAASHVLREPEVFWSIQHVAVYTGVAMIVISAIFGLVLLIKNSLDKRLVKGIKIIIAGAVMLILAGYADSVSHTIFGSGELVSIPHVILESAPALSAFGSFLVLSQICGHKARKLIPLAILTIIVSLGSVIFNLVMVLGGAILCILVYQVLSSGCAIL